MAWLLNNCGSKLASKFHKPIWIQKISIIFTRIQLWSSSTAVTILAHGQQNNRSKKTNKPQKSPSPFLWKLLLTISNVLWVDVGRRRFALFEPFPTFSSRFATQQRLITPSATSTCKQSKPQKAKTTQNKPIQKCNCTSSSSFAHFSKNTV